MIVPAGERPPVLVAAASTDPVTAVRESVGDWWNGWSTDTTQTLLLVIATVAVGVLVGQLVVALAVRRRPLYYPPPWARTWGAGSALVLWIALAAALLWTAGRPGTVPAAVWFALVGVLAAAWTFLATHARPRVFVDRFVLEEGVEERGPIGFSESVTAEFLALTTAPSEGVDVVATSDVVDMPVDGISLVPGGSILKAVIEVARRALPSSRLTVEGVLTNPKDARPSVNVRLRRGSRVLRAATVPAELFVESASGSRTLAERQAQWRDLATGVAAWLLVEVGGVRPRSVERLYGARRWESVALVAIAARREASGATGTALALLDRARDIDQTNLAAVFSHVSLRARVVRTDDAGAAATYLRVAEDLERLRRARVQRNGGVEPVDPLQWRIQYAMAAAFLNHVVQKTVRDDSDEERLRLVDGADRYRDALESFAAAGRRAGRGDRSLWRQLAALADPLMIVYGLQRVTPPPPGAHPETPPLVLTPREALNWACVLLWPRLEYGHEAASGAALRLELDRTVAAIGTSPDMSEAALSDPSLRRWRDDPDQRSRDKLYELLGLTPPLTPAGSVAALAACAPVADDLAMLGYATVRELAAADPRDVQEGLAGLGGIAPDRIRAVVDACILVSVGMPVDVANRFVLGGVTAGELVAGPVDAVVARLTPPARALGLDPLTREEVGAWRVRVREAADAARAAAAPARPSPKANGGPVPAPLAAGEVVVRQHEHSPERLD